MIFFDLALGSIQVSSSFTPPPSAHLLDQGSPTGGPRARPGPPPGELWSNNKLRKTLFTSDYFDQNIIDIYPYTGRPEA